MKNLIKLIFTMILLLTLVPSANAGSKDKGDSCNIDIECKATLECKGGVCVKKKAFDYGSGKSGKECSIDADCIGSGKCKSGNFGKKYCTG